MLEEIYLTELEYVKLFSRSYEDKKIIRFQDDNLPDMYTHNFIFIKNDSGLHKTRDIILTELARRKEQGLNFLRVESNFSFNEDLLSQLPVQPHVRKYDFMYIRPEMGDNLTGNQACIIKKAGSQTILKDGIEVDILANETDMGREFASRRISRKATVYERPDTNLDLYVCYYNETPIGNCELMLNNKIAKIEDFDILEKYQRRGFGTAVIKYLLNEVRENGVEIVYLITDSEDTAREMYKKCGFKKAGEKTELFFDLSEN